MDTHDINRDYDHRSTINEGSGCIDNADVPSPTEFRADQSDSPPTPSRQAAPSRARMEIAAVRATRGQLAYQKRDEITGIALKEARRKGRFFRTNTELFYFLGGEKPKLLPLDAHSAPLNSFIYNEFGINPAEKYEYKHIVAGLQNEAYTRGERVDVHRLSHYDAEAKTLYVARLDGFVYRLDGKNVECVPNGTGGVFFLDDPKWEPYSYRLGAPATDLLDRLIVRSVNFVPSGALSAEDQQWLYKAWLKAQFFGSLHPTKPLVLICGEKGGGKTSGQRKWLKLLYGPAGEVSALERSKPDGFIATISSEPIAVFDNVDEHIGWLPDHLAQVATGISIGRRKLYTTNVKVEFKPECWVALTSRTPKFIEGRDDLPDRSLIFQTGRLEKNKPEHVLLREVLDNRDCLWTELLNELNRIVEFLREQPDETDSVKFRMADFGNFVLTLAGLEGDRDNGIRILERLSSSQSSAVIEDDPLAFCLKLWVKEHKNQGRRVNSEQLNNELRLIADLYGKDWPYDSSRSLGQRLSHVKSDLAKMFRIEDGKDSSNQRWYRFWPDSLNPAEADSDDNSEPQVPEDEALETDPLNL